MLNQKEKIMYEIEKIKELAPAAFRMPEQGAENGVSKHYQFMTTAEIIDGLGGMGWNVHTATQQKSKKNPETTKHMLRFRHDEFGSLGVKGNVPEILLVNSHDRTTSLNFHVGIFRIICSNGLVVADETFNKLTVRHMGTTFDDVKKHITDITTNLPMVFNTINRFEGVMMSKTEQTEFAMRAMAIRFPEYINPKNNQLDITKINNNVRIDEILKPMRPEDNGDDLWRTYNRVQEHLIKGGFQHQGLGKDPRAARPITNIRMNLLLNKGLWSLADEFANQ
jgi:hypothetical protein